MPISNSKNGLQSKAWGPAFWHCLYSVAANYAPESGGKNPSKSDKLNAIGFVTYFGSSLPCGNCRKNFPKNVRSVVRHQFDGNSGEWLTNRNQFFKFVYCLHESVTLMICKHKLSFSYHDACDLFNKIRASDCNSGEGCNASKGYVLSLRLRPV